MKLKWHQIPFVLKRKISLTFLSGIASLFISTSVFIATNDTIMLILGTVIFVLSLSLGKNLWNIITNQKYSVVVGICSSISIPLIYRYRKIQLINEQGSELNLLIHKSVKLQIGTNYRFYFRNTCQATIGNDYLDSVLSTNNFLGYEVIETPE